MAALHTLQTFGGRKVPPGQLSTSQKCLTLRDITSNSGPRESGAASSSLQTTADEFAAAGCLLGDLLVGLVGVEADIGLVFDDMISHCADS